MRQELMLDPMDPGEPGGPHACMTLRGVRALGTTTVTSALLGALHADARSRSEFFALAGVTR
jgi:GTP cyclohydrolase IA